MTNATDKAGPYDVYVGDDRVYFESRTEGEDDAVCVYHDKGHVYDYDMSFCLPDTAREWLDSNGYNTEDILG